MPRKTYSHTTASDPTAGEPLAPRSLTKQEFGRRLYRLMIERGWHQSELARQAGLPRVAISTYIRGKSLPSPVNLKKLAATFEIEPEELLPNITESAVADEEGPAFEMKVSIGAPDRAWVRVNRLVSTTTAVKIAALLENDIVFDRERSSGATSLLDKEDKETSA